MKYFFINSYGIVKEISFEDFFKILTKSVVERVNFYSESYEDDLLMEYIKTFKKLLRDGLVKINKKEEYLEIKGV